MGQHFYRLTIAWLIPSLLWIDWASLVNSMQETIKTSVFSLIVLICLGHVFKKLTCVPFGSLNLYIRTVTSTLKIKKMLLKPVLITVLIGMQQNWKSEVLPAKKNNRLCISVFQSILLYCYECKYVYVWWTLISCYTNNFLTNTQSLI